MAIELLAGVRKENETDKAVIACNDYLRMGAGRSIDKVQQKYSDSTVESPPTKNLRVLFRWSSSFGWVERAQAYENALQAIESAEVQRLRTQGLAADFERIRELDTIYQALKVEFKEGKGLWYTDIKMSAKGDTVDVPVFNKALIDSMRGVLDDIAKEAGGRKVKSEITGKDGSDMILRVVYGDDGTDGKAT